MAFDYFHHRGLRAIWSCPRKTFAAYAALLLLAAGAGGYLRFVNASISLRVLQPSSDESISALMAREIREGARPLLFHAQPYLFPVESYLIAPFAHLLTPDAQGARIPLLALQTVGLAVSVWLAVRLLPDLHSRAAALLLILVPSPYVLMVQSMYCMPGYAFLMAAGFSVIALGLLAERMPRLGCAMMGLLGGIGFSAHQLFAVYVAPSAVVAFLRVPLRRLAGAICAFVLGLCVGLIPYAAAKWTQPGAHQAVEQKRSWSSALKWIWEPTLSHTLPAALGWRLCPFPDQPVLSGGHDWLARTHGPALALLLLLFPALRIRSALRTHGAGREGLSARDLPWLVFAANLAIFAASERATSSSFRYLLPAATMFPYLVGEVVARTRRMRLIVVLAALALTTSNAAGAIRLNRIWQHPTFPAERASIPDLVPALNTLRELGIRRAVASFGAAYRIHWQSGGEIPCAQPQNERFPNWPIPYVEQVWDGQPLAYVLTDRIRFLKPEVFERHLNLHGVTSQIATAGEFRIYYDFHGGGYDPAERKINSRRIRVHASASSESAFELVDGDLSTEWTTPHLMKGDECLAVEWGRPFELSRLVLVQGRHRNDIPFAYRILCLAPDSREGNETIVPARLDKFELVWGRPRYGRAVQSIPLHRVRATGIRIEIAEPQTNRNWTVAEIEVYVRPAEGDGIITDWIDQ
ncbi:MAG: hypothetical protein NZ740_04925 [Kiritimatiellae bacterium]|nr:hypothetical protein [Kiritimatiellia bacterium]MDW8458435.1 hypothetical protein [Verrucomicrobiota bacterium]